MRQLPGYRCSRIWTAARGRQVQGVLRCGGPHQAWAQTRVLMSDGTADTCAAAGDDRRVSFEAVRWQHTSGPSRQRVYSRRLPVYIDNE